MRLRILASRWLILLSACLAGYVAISGSGAVADEPQTQGIEIPTGKLLTPAAATGAIFQDLNPRHAFAPEVRAGGAAAVAVSPDGKLLAILTSGFNSFSDRSGKSLPELSTEYIFLFDITGAQPRQLQVLPLHATFQGLAWHPSSDRFFVSLGVDDAVVEFVRRGPAFVRERQFELGHKAWVGADYTAWGGSGRAIAGGLALSPDGRRLLASNLMNDSVSLIDLASGKIVAEQDLRPGIINPKQHGKPGGTYPRAVAWSSPGRAYVASERDREIISIAVSGNEVHVIRRMPVEGQPVALVANRSGSRVYAALDTTNSVAIFDTSRDKLIESLDVVAPESVYGNARKLGGANTNALTLTPDERTLLVSNGGENAIAVLRLSVAARGAVASRRKTADRDDDDEGGGGEHSNVAGLVPTGWYPAGVATSRTGSAWYVINGKSPTGPNGGAPAKDSDQLTQGNRHVEQLEKAGFLTMPSPAPLELARLTKQVARNNHFDQPDKTAADARLFAFLRDHIKHVIYIMKENRPYDQVLGDLEIGNGDPRLTLFPERITPNHHAVARNFVILDNTLVSGEGSMQGWSWTISAQTTDFDERMEPIAYAGRAPVGWYGNNRSISMGHATSQERHAELSLSPADPDILPGKHDVFAPDGPGGEEGSGYLWDVALRRGRTIRNWGMAPNPTVGFGWSDADHGPVPDVRDPYAQKQRVFWTSKASLMPYSDPYFRTFYPAFPDYWRVKEWKREFAEFSAANPAPNLMLIWLGGDHTGLFDRALDGVNTPETQVADNDYALGLIVDAVANSPFAKDTLIVSIEDDAWDGADHVDAHRTIALFAGPYVRQRAVVSTRYTTVNVVKTIEEILGIGPIGLNDALAAPMSDIFDPNATTWSYKAIVPDVLRSTKLPLPPANHAHVAYPSHSAAYWAKAMAGQDFSGPDRIDPVTFTRALWRGLKVNAPYPPKSTRADLRTNRAQSLAQTKWTK
jgi:DNA-binding beta-propeller fold protein YncE